MLPEKQNPIAGPGRIDRQIARLLTSDNCPQCGLRPKHRKKKWCRRCIDRYRRRKPSEEKIIETIEPLYADAQLADLDAAMAERILSRPQYQDVFIYGFPGVGKTYAMAAFIRHYMQAKYQCERINFDDFCCRVRATMSPASRQSEWQMVKPLTDADLLFIDDLGLRSKQETDFAYVTLYSILNKRQERLLSTFISSNKDLDRLRESFDQRIVSRLMTALQIEMTGKDRREHGQQIETAD